MANEVTSLKKIQELQAQIANLREDAIQELRERREALLRELDSIESELAELTGKPAAGAPGRTRKRSGGNGRSIPLQELKEMLAAAPGKTINIRQEGLDLKNIKTLASANPHLLQMGGKGPWPSVTLLK
jgi:DNA repair exonuclease SbcCD ATPase subunit